ncbi:dolichyl-diphosphooligosaccharide-protein glycotransferase [Mycena capillaripes]|nr:dolichyl-diphosphooligosaccharide-protein glycotransferase [Mycena capillaripes]
MSFLPFMVATGAWLVFLIALAAEGRGVIKLDYASYGLLTAENRTWSASIEFTSLDPRNNCGPCKGFHPSWTAIAKAWSKVPPAHRDRHFFGTVDFVDSPRIIRSLSLKAAPTIHVYPPTEGPLATGKSVYWTYDFSTHGYEPLPLAQQLSHVTPIPIPYTAPFAWDRWVAGSAGVLALATALRLRILRLRNVWPWAISTIVTSLVMTSGYMFTRIRDSPWMGRNAEWIAPGMQNQFGREVHVVFAIYGTLAFSFVVLIMLVPRQHSAFIQRVLVYCLIATIGVVYSILVGVVRVKNTHYPFKLLL